MRAHVWLLLGVTSVGCRGFGSGTPPPGTPPDESCLARPFLSALGRSRLIVGAQLDTSIAKSASLDVRYLYLAGGLFDSNAVCTSCTKGCAANATSCDDGGCDWWGCWQDTSKPPGEYLRGFLADSHSAGQVPMITYYELLQASGADDGPGEVFEASKPALMKRYFADFRFVLQNLGDQQALLLIEPDFWGYAQYGGDDAHNIPAAVSTGNPTDCGDFEDSVAGMGRCLLAMTRKYAPRTLVGLHASAWSTQTDATENKDSGLDVASEAAKTAAFLVECGAREGDFVGVETSDRDAGYYQLEEGTDRWWDASNAKLPNFHQAFAWAKALAEGVKRPTVWWQTPLGNLSLANTPKHWKDNRVDYFFAHLDELVAAHSGGMLFGSGAGDQTNPGTDGGNMLGHAKTYIDSGGLTVCP